MALRLGFASSALLLLGCGTENPIPEGEPIPGTSIVSCGDQLLGLAAPSGTLHNPSIVVSDSQTTLATGFLWQVSCPKVESDAQTEFAIDRLTLYRNDAGYPGEELGSSDVEARGVVSCSGRVTTAIGGATKSQTSEPVAVLSLRELCEERASAPTGSPLFVHVEATGIATTCSSQELPLLFRRKVGVTCEVP